MVTDQDLTVLGVGCVFFFPALPAAWKSASLRGDAYQKWSSRVDLAFAALTDRAIEKLEDLRDETGRLLSENEGFTPEQYVVDPAPLAKTATDFNQLLRYRARLRPNLRGLLNVMNSALAICVVYAVGVLIATLRFSNLAGPSWFEGVGVIVAVIAATASLLLLATYAYLEHRLTRAEIRSSQSLN
jgi:hypothetical protein